jgi:hypothetical protein
VQWARRLLGGGFFWRDGGGCGHAGSAGSAAAIAGILRASVVLLAVIEHSFVREAMRRIACNHA